VAKNEHEKVKMLLKKWQKNEHEKVKI